MFSNPIGALTDLVWVGLLWLGFGFFEPVRTFTFTARVPAFVPRNEAFFRAPQGTLNDLVAFGKRGSA